jgi:hypothetical protein
MANSHVTFGQLLRYLEELGFTTDEAREGTRVCRHPDTDALFLFRERPPGDPTRDHELLAVHAQLQLRGLIPEQDFHHFCAAIVQPRAVGSRSR